MSYQQAKPYKGFTGSAQKVYHDRSYQQCYLSFYTCRLLVP